MVQFLITEREVYGKNNVHNMHSGTTITDRFLEEILTMTRNSVIVGDLKEKPCRVTKGSPVIKPEFVMEEAGDDPYIENNWKISIPTDRAVRVWWGGPL